LQRLKFVGLNNRMRLLQLRAYVFRDADHLMLKILTLPAAETVEHHLTGIREEGDHYHTVANPANGEKPGERGAGPPKPTGYRPTKVATAATRQTKAEPGQ
jgi:hypothetical protein